jgi:hypothetical protein
METHGQSSRQRLLLYCPPKVLLWYFRMLFALIGHLCSQYESRSREKLANLLDEVSKLLVNVD